ncbi:hypothetical protein BCU97_23415 [Vibrio splendidus]|uniref:hypothetical protein n=1 Tax=Vibrio splendidus TaxID=29497 RepID=UPI000C81A2C4|nr:hypothetical protein [Vibrio splendidus]PMG19396.1 hypothetical protein BCU97_23415 [Vibrio splendidus]
MTKLERLEENIEDLLIIDISDITALVIRDGYDDYSYTHKSIQEYFAAVFINRLPEERKCAFYSMIIFKPYEFSKWQNSLAFLETLDQRNYLKYFLIPFKKNLLKLTENNDVKMTYNQVIQLLGEDSRVLVSEDGYVLDLYWGDTIASALYKEYSSFAKSKTRCYLDSIRTGICDVICFSINQDYEDYLTGNGDFLIPLDHIIEYSNHKKSLAIYISNSFENSRFKQEVLALEEELLLADAYTSEILPF